MTTPDRTPPGFESAVNTTGCFFFCTLFVGQDSEGFLLFGRKLVEVSTLFGSKRSTRSAIFFCVSCSFVAIGGVFVMPLVALILRCSSPLSHALPCPRPNNAPIYQTTYLSKYCLSVPYVQLTEISIAQLSILSDDLAMLKMSPLSYKPKHQAA